MAGEIGDVYADVCGSDKGEYTEELLMDMGRVSTGLD